MGAAADCELIGPGLLGQPVNTLTTLLFVVVGAMVIRRPPVRWIGIGLIATGVGSFLFHGPMPPGSEWAHDVSLAWLIVLVGSLGRPWERFSRAPALVTLGALFAVAPIVADPLAAVLTVGAVVLLLASDRSRATVLPLALLGITAILGRLGATGGPFCDPDSVWQLHGLWHVSAAIAVAWFAFGAAERARTTV